MLSVPICSDSPSKFEYKGTILKKNTTIKAGTDRYISRQRDVLKKKMETSANQMPACVQDYRWMLLLLVLLTFEWRENGVASK